MFYVYVDFEGFMIYFEYNIKEVLDIQCCYAMSYVFDSFFFLLLVFNCCNFFFTNKNLGQQTTKPPSTALNIYI